MTSKPKFGNWIAFADKVAKDHRVCFHDAEEMIRQSMMKSPASGNVVTYNCHAVEHNWNCIGRPYYKVWPGITHAMRDVSLDVPSECLRRPYEFWELRLPYGTFHDVYRGCVLVRHSFRDELGGREMFRRAGTGGAKEHNKIKLEDIEKDGRVQSALEFYYMHGDDPRGTVTLTTFYVRLGRTIKQGYDEFLGNDDDGGAWLTRDHRAWLFRIVVGVTLFAINQHEMIMPDVKQEVIERKPRGKKKQKAMAQMARKPVNPKGWLVGSEIDLPRPIVTGNGAARSLGEELEYGHMRSGHMKMQPCGRGSKERKLIFVAPTIVRPDLPFRQAHGYRIRDKVLPSA